MTVSMTQVLGPYDAVLEPCLEWDILHARIICWCSALRKMDVSNLLLSDLGEIWDMLQMLMKQIQTVGGIGSILYFCSLMLFFVCVYRVSKSQFLPHFRRNSCFSEVGLLGRPALLFPSLSTLP